MLLMTYRHGPNLDQPSTFSTPLSRSSHTQQAPEQRRAVGVQVPLPGDMGQGGSQVLGLKQRPEALERKLEPKSR